MTARIQEEIGLLRKYYPDLEIDEDNRWILIPDYPLPRETGWNKAKIDICIEIRKGYPGTPPYGIYVPPGLRCRGQAPQKWQARANNQPSFPGDWAMLSWSPDGQWEPKSNVVKGSNMLNFVLSFKERFKQGQ